MNGEEWSDLENDAIVADYFSMLSDELAGSKYNKAAHNRALQDVIGRSKGSIEFKHQNISAVLKGLGETWINGYKPAFNFSDVFGRCPCPAPPATRRMDCQEAFPSSGSIGGSWCNLDWHSADHAKHTAPG